MSVARVRQPYLEVDPPPYDVVGGVQLSPGIRIAGVLRQILAVGIVILVLYPHHLARVEQFLRPRLGGTRQARRVR